MLTVDDRQRLVVITVDVVLDQVRHRRVLRHGNRRGRHETAHLLAGQSVPQLDLADGLAGGAAQEHADQRPPHAADEVALEQPYHAEDDESQTEPTADARRRLRGRTQVAAPAPQR